MATNPLEGLASLLKGANLDDHNEILQKADGVLQKTPGALEAEHIKLIALLKLDRFDEAALLLDARGPLLKQTAPLPCAYALYKTGQLDEAKQVLSQKQDEADLIRAFRHLEAQILYRAENFSRAVQSYKELVQSGSDHDSESGDLRINGGAAEAQLLWTGGGSFGQATRITSQDLEHFETAFNAACNQIAQGNLKQAEFLLSKAKSLCVAADDLPAEDKHAELLPIIAQQLFVLSQMGNLSEAQKLTDDLVVSNIEDASTRHIAQVNVLAVSSQKPNPFLFERLLSGEGQPPPMDAAFHFQMSALHQNQHVISLRTGKHLAVTKGAAKLSYPESSPSIHSALVASGICSAAAYAQHQTDKAASKKLVALPGIRLNDIGFHLAVVQLHLYSNDLSSATSYLEKVFAALESSSDSRNLDVRFSPGLVAILVELYIQTSRSVQVTSELGKASAYWRASSTIERSDATLFSSAAMALLRDADASTTQMAHELFELARRREQSKTTLAGLRASTTTLQPTDSHHEILAIIKEFGDSTKAGDLELAGIPRSAAPTFAGLDRKRVVAHVPNSKRTKKPRPTKVSIFFDAAQGPDPERWLPTRDRSTWRPKGKKKNRTVAGMSTQGGVVSEESRPSTPVASQIMQHSRPKTKLKKKSKTSS